MKYCARCLYPENHPLGIVLDDEGICSGCRVHEEKYTLDWEQRFEKLRQIANIYRHDSPSAYDCIVPVSGARDSYFILHVVTKLLRLRPILVSYNRHFNTLRGIRNLAYLRTNFDGDYVQQTLSPKLIKRITRETIRRRGSIYWPVLAGQTVWPVQVAVRLKIPLIIWGAHQGLDQVGMYSHADEVEMSRKYRRDHDLMDLEAEDLIDGEEGLTENDLKPFMYPHDRELSRVGVRGIYLGNYIPWDSKAQHERMLELYEYETARQLRTFDTYNDADCHHYSGLHDWVKFCKWGYGKVTDHASREIRLGRMSRQEGVAMVEQYQDVPPADKARFLEWIELSEAEFDAYIDRFRDPAIWSRDSAGNWLLRDCVSRRAMETDLKTAALPRREPWSDFRVTSSKGSEEEEQDYFLMARGYDTSHPAVVRRRSQGGD